MLSRSRCCTRRCAPPRTTHWLRKFRTSPRSTTKYDTVHSRQHFVSVNAVCLEVASGCTTAPLTTILSRESPRLHVRQAQYTTRMLTISSFAGQFATGRRCSCRCPQNSVKKTEPASQHLASTCWASQARCYVRSSRWLDSLIRHRRQLSGLPTPSSLAPAPLAPLLPSQRLPQPPGYQHARHRHVRLPPGRLPWR